MLLWEDFHTPFGDSLIAPVANDSLAAASGGTGNRDVTYDSRGNIRHLGGQGFLYNAMNRPTSIAGDVDAVYRYDGHGRPVRSLVYKDTGYILRYNVYGASGDLIFNVQIDQSPANEDYVSTYVKMDGKTLARVKSVGQAFNYTDTVTYLHNDHLGSASSGTLADGSITWREDYSPFGITLQNDASNDNQPGFTGHIKDNETGLNYMQARYYDPVIGRFLSIDPVTFMDTGDTGQFNRYTYANNDPINMIDPNGEDAFRILVGEAGLNEHNVGRNFSRAANTRAQQLRAGGHTVEIRNVGTRQEFAQGFRSETPIDGGVIYMGHSNNASLFVGENSGRDTNFSYEDASSLQGHDLAEGATIELNSCFSGAGDTAVAAHISAWTERSVVAPTTSMGFTGTEGEYLSGAGARPPETGPIYMEPMPNGELRTFDPPD